MQLSKGIFLKLSKRLQQLDKMIATPYQHIWDCCCDHGMLGMTLLARQAAPHIHFVDIVTELMHTLEDKLQYFFSNSASSWTTHCLDVQQLPLEQYQSKQPTQDKHLVIIAGVGGDLITQLIEGIYRNNPTMDIDFLLCPVHHQFMLRKKLIELNFSLKDEVLMAENKRFYELLLVSSNSNDGNNISPIGNKIWQADSTEQTMVIKHYLRKTINHYQRIQLSHNANVQDIIDAYQTKLS